MVNLTIGRAGFDLDLTYVQDLTVSEERVRMSGHTWDMDFEEAQILREQLVAYGDGSPDESFVPVTCVDMPSLNGYYQNVQVSVSAAQGRANVGVFDFTIEMDRVGGFAAPLIEVRGQGATRVNSQSVTALAAHGVPGAARSWQQYNPLTNLYTTGAATLRGSETGEVAWRNAERPFKQYFVAPDRFYDGAATLCMGETLTAVVGRQIRNEPDMWVLSNGLIRVRPEYTGDVFGLVLQAWTGAGWGAEWAVELLGGVPTRSQLPDPHTITVLRNTPEEVRLRFTTGMSTALIPVYVDVRMRRGVRFAEFRISSPSGANQPGVNTTGFGSATDLAGGWGNGTQVVGGPFEIGKTSSTMYANEGSVTQVDLWDFCLGVLPTSGTTTDMNNLIREYMWSVTEVQTVVAR